MESGVARVVVGMRHPLPHMRGAALACLRSRGVEVDLLESEVEAGRGGLDGAAALRACLDVNAVRVN